MDVGGRHVCSGSWTVNESRFVCGVRVYVC